jgi:hypothetical protein
LIAREKYSQKEAAHLKTFILPKIPAASLGNHYNFRTLVVKALQQLKI